MILVTLLFGSVSFAQDDSYPDVWWRETPRNLATKGYSQTFLAVEKTYESNPSESPEIFIVMEKFTPNRKIKNSERVFVIQEFFSGNLRWVKRAFFGDGNFPTKFQLSDGTLLELMPTTVTPPPESEFEDMDKEEGQKTAPPDRFGVQVISAFGGLEVKFWDDPMRKWVHPSVVRTTDLNSGIVNCDPFYWGLQAFDKQGKRLWQHVIAAHGKLVPKSLGKSGKSGADPYYDGCWAPGQYEVDTAKAVGPTLRDDTMLVYLRDYVLRIRLKDGYPARMPPQVSIMDYAGVIRLKEVLSDAAYERFSLLVDASKADTKRLKSIAYDYGYPNNFFAIQDYFFPQLAARRFQNLSNKVQPSIK